jgi:hypothetical protein
MVEDPNLPPPVIADDGASQPSAAEPAGGSRLNGNAEDVERDALTAADYAAAGVEAPDWANDPFPDMETWRKWQASQNKALAFKRANAGKA